MAHNELVSSTDSSENQFVLSYELLALLHWLIEHDAERIKKLISKALASGLREKIQYYKSVGQSQEIEEVHHSIIEFFGLLEVLLLEATNEHTMQTALERNLMPAIDHIDGTACDTATLRFSIEKAASKLSKSPQENPQQVLFKELLKCWKPGNKKVLN